MIELSTIRDLVAIFGVIAGFTYYVMTVRNANRARRKDLLFQRLNTWDAEFYNNWLRIFGIQAPKWETELDFYDHIEEHPEDYGFVSQMLITYQSIGTLLKEGIIDSDYVFNLASPNMVIWAWDRVLPIVEAYRNDINYPEYFSNFEYLYDVACAKYPNIRHYPEYREVLRTAKTRFDAENQTKNP